MGAGGVLVSAPGREELRASLLRRHPCYCEDACRCTAGHVARDLDALLKLERERALTVLLRANVISEKVAAIVREGFDFDQRIADISDAERRAVTR